MLFSSCRSFGRYFVGAVLGALSLGISASAQPALEMPEDSLPQLREFIDHALRQSPRAIVRGFDEAVADADLLTAKSARLPNLSASADMVRSEEDRGDFSEPQTADKVYYRVSMSQPIYHWGVISRNIQNAKIRRDIEAGRTRQAMLTMVNEIRRKYLELMIQKKVVERYRFSMQLVDEKLADAEEKRRLNTLSEGELQAQRQSHKRSLVGVRYQEDGYMVAKSMFSRMVGVDLITDDDIADEFPELNTEDDAAAIESLALRFKSMADPTNLDLQIQLKELEIKQKELKNAKMSLRPRVNAIAGLTQDEQSYSANIGNRYEYQSLYAGIGVYWTIWDGFASRGAVRASLNRMRAAEVNYESTKNRIFDDIDSLERQLDYRSMEVSVEDEELVIARNHLNYTQQRFDRGEASENELSQARINLLERWGGTMTARMGYWERLFHFLSLMDADPAADLLPANSR
ncbi:TolC family protein [Actomonas aquatica]|uniref:TolC family protein n=1 Tax=Actomonas aquatica TaxID=2866162 RepID=A0ABZ1C9W5_9BACT|nr:TolC family protein [Opitutus sp. WL0086]WRQ88481.1 TolC family protein [Opitutus sp. WL0086]